MRIVDFANAHIEQAANIAKQNYETERGREAMGTAQEFLS